MSDWLVPRITEPDSSENVNQPAPSLWRSADVQALIILVVICALATVPRIVRDDWLSGYDGFNYFFPSWAYLGDRLSAFELPIWNPYYGSGSPMIGDPGSGWMYLPVMLSFTLFGAIAAWKFLIFLMAVICGCAIYGFARKVGLWPLPSLLAAVAFAIGPVSYGMATDRIALSTQYPAIAISLLSTEMALRATRRSSFFGWTALAGIGLSQAVVSWPAQGTLYCCIYVGGWLAYRTFFAPTMEIGGRLQHLKRSLWFGLGAIVATLGFAGAGLWPSLEYIDQSTIAGGDYTKTFGGVNLPTAPILNLIAAVLQDVPYSRITSASGLLVVFAVFALVVGRNRYGIPFLAVAVWLFIDMSSNESLSLHLFYLIPYFEHIHGHRPSAASAYVFPSLALLGAAGLQLALEHRPRALTFRSIAITVALLGSAVIYLDSREIKVGWWPIGTGIAAVLFILLKTVPRERVISLFGIHTFRISSLALIALLLVYPTGIDYGRIMFSDGQTPGLEDVDPSVDDVEWVVNTTAKSSDPNSAAEYLQRQRDLQQPFRYASYYAADTASGQHLPFLWRRLDPAIVGTLAGSRAGFLELQQISGYNPVHLKYYVEYFEMMQEVPQNYHFVDVFYRALDMSQLFAMLNVRYVLIDINLGFVPPIAKYGTEVYRDSYSIIYENPYAFPRAWITHDIRPDTGDISYLDEMNSYFIDGHHVAYVDGPIPNASFPDGDKNYDSVVVQRYDPERIVLKTSSTTDGLLVLSEIYTSGWHASIDGQSVDILRTNHAFRGIALPAGDHDVVLTYFPRSVTIGLWSTGATSIVMIGIWSWAAVDRKRQPGHVNKRD